MHKKTAGDGAGYLLLKKAIDQETSIFKIIPPGELQCVNDEDHGLEFLTTQVSLAQCAEMMNTIQSIVNKLVDALQKWSLMGLEEQSNALSSHCANLIKCMSAVKHRVVVAIHGACGASLEGLHALQQDRREAQLQELSQGALRVTQELAAEKIPEKYTQVIKAMGICFGSAKLETGVESVRVLEEKFANTMKVLELISLTADLGNIQPPKDFASVLASWGEGNNNEKPYMDKVIDFVALSSGVRKLDMIGSSKLARDFHKLLVENAFVKHLQEQHVFSRLEDVMLSLNPNLCHGECFPEDSTSDDLVEKISRDTLESLPGLLFNNAVAVANLVAAAPKCFEQAASVSLTNTVHDRTVSIVTCAVSAIGETFLPPDLFDGLWDGAVEARQSQKALELCRLYSKKTSLAFCLSFAHKFLADKTSIVTGMDRMDDAADAPGQEVADKRCFVALKSASLLVKHLRDEISAKGRFFPTEQQRELKKISEFCSIADVALTRYRKSLCYAVQQEFITHSQKMTELRPNWTPAITPTH